MYNADAITSFRVIYDRLLLGEKLLLPIPDPEKASRLRSLLSTYHSRSEKKLQSLGCKTGLSLVMGKAPGKSTVYELYLGERKNKAAAEWKIISEDELEQYE